MHKKFINKLICPQCKKDLKIKRIFLAKRNNIVYGFLKCECCTYPILDGILFIQRDKSLKTFIVFIILKIIPFKYFTFNQFINFISHLKLINKEWASYLINRFKRKDFFPTAIASTCIKKDGYILDAGCGMGHLIHLLKSTMAEENICGLDHNLVNLYLSKSYACSNCNYIYTHLNQRLPFKSKSFQNIISSDVFHYIANKKLLGKEFKRILTNKGLIALTNLHNKHFSQYFIDPVDYPETPQDYIEFFPNLNFSLFSQEHSHKGVLKWVNIKNFSNKADKLKTFTLIFSKDRGLQKDIQSNLATLIPKDSQLVSTV
ncbi:methyltransferase domain-containing protein [Patescibacteria group bacterium]|nr:methyltransferase domain-containing protein [Patescibacteria group bacterium]MBU0777228.1 methyltransferase domain-containing protein [Patescibacteria group bacterium]MBU0845923.1 methyltransferase domain-containing protein [Patescibacteria group bacterium]MBU0922951.1 methyltransferase domain-containing protein [Patescibacteria group bacterium]MBU1066199.1 methyltransferase domain-containing protein [Patescibacteria group bacterium]